MKYRLAFLLVFHSITPLFAADAPPPTPGLVDKQPDSGFFVKTDRGFMVPYKS